MEDTYEDENFEPVTPSDQLSEVPFLEVVEDITYNWHAKTKE